MSGCVYLVGAGPGDPGLITLKAIWCLQKAAVVLYDELAHKNLLHYAPASAIKRCVGKQKGKHSVQQQAINELCISYAKQGLTVVRLKGGDPFIFGRGGEECAQLAAQGIAFQIVPGVSSTTAVPAYSGIPLTFRQVSRSVAFITGTTKEGSGSTIPIPQVGTLVYLMGANHLAAICKSVLDSGFFKADTPAALLYKGTYAAQDKLIGTLATLPELQNKSKIKTPALLVIGAVNALSNDLEWREKLPLFGKRIISLRHPDQTKSLASDISFLGGELILAPIHDYLPEEAPSDFVAQLKRATYIIFTSANAVTHFFDALRANTQDTRALGHVKIVSIGPATSDALATCGITPDTEAQTHVSEGLFECFPDHLPKDIMLIPSARVTRRVLDETLQQRGAEIIRIPLYTSCPKDDFELTLEEGDSVIFASPSQVKTFFSKISTLPSHWTPVCIGEITAKTLATYTTPQPVIATTASTAGIVDVLRQL